MSRTYLLLQMEHTLLGNAESLMSGEFKAPAARTNNLICQLIISAIEIHSGTFHKIKSPVKMQLDSRFRQIQLFTTK